MYIISNLNMKNILKVLYIICSILMASEFDLHYIKDNELIIKAPKKPEVKKAIPQKQYQIKAKNVTIGELCMLLDKVFEKKFTSIFSSDIRININLENLSEKDVISELVNQFNIGFVETEYGYKVYPPMLISRMFPILYHGFGRSGSGSSGGGQRAGTGSGSTSLSTKFNDTFWQDLKKELDLIINKKDKETFFINESGKHVTVKAMPKSMHNIEKIINKINNDYKYQVILEAHILQFSHTKNHTFNIEWNKIIEQINSLQNSLQLHNATDNMIDPVVHIIKLISSNGKTSILSSPRASMFNNQKSIIQFGKSTKELQHITIDKDDSNSTPISDSIKYQLQDVFLGIIFSASANIINKDEVILHIQPMISSETSDKESTQIPKANGVGTVEIPFKTIDQKQSDTVIKANNNDIVIIGGLTNTTKVEDKNTKNIFEYIFPFIRGKVYKFKKEELIIIIKVNIVEHCTTQNINFDDILI